MVREGDRYQERQKRVYYRVTALFTRKPLSAEAQYAYYDWFTS